MTDCEEIVFEFSKLKILRFLAVSCVFLALGVSALLVDPTFFEGHSQPRNIENIRLSGLLISIFASLVIIVFLKKLFINKPGIVINDLGILNNTSNVAPEYIPWAEITGAKIYEFKYQKFLVILVNDHQKYINRGNALKIYMNSANYKKCGSPITIATNFLKTNLTELTEIFDKYHKKNRIA